MTLTNEDKSTILMVIQAVVFVVAAYKLWKMDRAWNKKNREKIRRITGK